jgi:hypothetical protein
MKYDHHAHEKCPQISINKAIREIKKYTHTTSQLSAICEWAQLFNFIDDMVDASVFTADSTGTATLLSTKKLNAQSSNSHMLTCCFTYTVQLLYKHSFITFQVTHSNTIHCKKMFSNNNTSVTTALPFGITRKWIFLLVFSLLSLICVCEVQSTTFRLIHCTPLQKLKQKKEYFKINTTDLILLALWKNSQVYITQI